jgi:hypothetical protein
MPRTQIRLPDELYRRAKRFAEEEVPLEKLRNIDVEGAGARGLRS